jgi:AraC-like DNA-binding protein
MTKVARYRFAEPNDYGAGFDEGEADLVVSGAGRFRASCDYIDTERLRIVVGDEEIARVAYVKLRADEGLVTFPIAKGSTLIVRGQAVRFGEFMWHAPANRFHERITGHTQWARIRLRSAKLSNAVRALAHPALLAPVSGQLIVPDRTHRETLIAAVKQAAALARLHKDHTLLWEVAQSIELTLQQVLTGSVSHPAQSPPNKTSNRHHEIMLRLEDLLPAWLQHPLQLPAIAEALQTSERTLRTCCEEHLGIGLHRYLRLRRLKLTRHYLSQSDARTTSVAAVARRYGFLDLGRFAATYLHTFGELPSATLARLRRSAASGVQPNSALARHRASRKRRSA